jgi:glycosyltransferase involved in cell wall biosynthesis
MKILHINDNYCYLGGAEKYLLDICKELEGLGHQIIIISSSEREHSSTPGRKEYFVKPSYGLKTGLKIWDIYKGIVEEEDPDIIHLHNSHCFLSPLVAKRLMKIMPVVKFVHDARLFCPHPMNKIIPSSNELCFNPLGWHCFNRKGCYPFLLRRSKLFDNLREFFFVYWELLITRMLPKTIVSSQYMYNELLRNGFEKNKISIIPLYTDKGLNLGNGVFFEERGLVLCIGRFDGVKGIPQFIDALQSIKDQKWHAEIVGDGIFRKSTEERVKQFGLEKRVTFRGRLSSEEIDHCYQRCSMVVIPSLIPEAFGLVGIEAMTFGKPVVAFDSGGIREWLIDGETGFLVKRGDIRGLGDRISQLLKEESLAREMGKKGKERVEKFYRKDIHLKKLLAIYEEVINKRARSGAP